MISESVLSKAFWEKGRHEDCPIIDVHGHMGSYRAIWMPQAGLEDMIHTMDRCGIRLLCFSHHQALTCPDIGNSATFQAARQYPHRFKAYLTINPNYPEIIAKDLADFDLYKDVCIGFKIHASWFGIPMDTPVYESAWKFADERNLLVLAHTWGDSEWDGPQVVRKIAQRYRNIKFILGHCLHGCWDDAVKIASDFPHTYLDLTGVFDDRGAIEEFVEAGLSKQILFGTDLPWFNPLHGVGALLSADIADEDRLNILYRNATNLLNLDEKSYEEWRPM